MPSSPGFRIKAIWAFVAIEDDDEEGIVAQTVPFMGSIPFIAADEKRLGQLAGRAQEIADATGKTIRLVRFDVRTDVEVIEPKPRKGSS